MTLTVLRIIFEEAMDIDIKGYRAAHLDLLLNGLLARKTGEG